MASMRAVDYALMAVLGIMIALPFSADIAPLAVLDTYQDAVNVTYNGTVHDTTLSEKVVTANIRGNIGIFSISPECWFQDADAEGTTTDCYKDHGDEDDLLKKFVTTFQTKDDTTCDWKKGFLTPANDTDDCTGKRNDWCESNHGLSITSLILILMPVVFAGIAMLVMQMDLSESKIFDYVIMASYTLVGIFVFAIAGNTSDIVTSSPEDCGFDPTDEDDFYGTGVISSGTYVYFAVGIICFVRAISMLLQKFTPNVPQTLMLWTYGVFLVLAIVAAVSPIVTISLFNLDTQREHGEVHKTTIQAWSSHTIVHTISDSAVLSATKNTIDNDWMESTCSANSTFFQYSDCADDFEDWCYNTHTTSIMSLSLIGIGLLVTVMQVFKGRTAGDQIFAAGSWFTFAVFHRIMLFVLLIVMGVHSGWTTMLVNANLDENGDCGFDPKNGSDGGGPALYMTHIIAWSSLVLLLVLQFATDKQTGELGGFRLML